MSAILTGFLVLGASAAARGGVEVDPANAGPADIELRKSFRSSNRASRQLSRAPRRSASGAVPGVAEYTDVGAAQQLVAFAEALGEPLQFDGTLHLPEIGDGGIVLQGAITPILLTTAGRHLIIDRGRTLDPSVQAAISRRWPGFSVVQPLAGSNLRDLVGTMLDAAGYDSVLRSAPLTFGRGVTIRITPDFVVLRTADDLLAGETRAISVVDPAEALPAELRELAGEHRVRVFELTPDGAPAVIAAPWRDPVGRVTTMETARLAPIIREIAAALAVSDVFNVSTSAVAGGNTNAIDPTTEIGALLKRCAIPSIGPVVEFFREQLPGSPRRFVISVPGWLAESGGRRLLITGTPVPLLVRLFLTREGIDIFEYRIR